MPTAPHDTEYYLDTARELASHVAANADRIEAVLRACMNNQRLLHRIPKTASFASCSHSSERNCPHRPRCQMLSRF